MTDKQPEQQARELINAQLEEKGWSEIEETVGTGYIEEYQTSSGPVDYALVVDGEILGLIEAKKSDYNSSAAFAQAERYSEDLKTSYSFGHKSQYHVPFVFTANGEKVEMKDLREYASSTKRELRGFHTSIDPPVYSILAVTELLSTSSIGEVNSRSEESEEKPQVV